MAPLVFWNEVSERPAAPDPGAADLRMNLFVDTLAAVQRAARGLPAVRLRLHVSPMSIELAPGYYVGTWLQRTDGTRRLLFLQLAASAPLLNAAVDPLSAQERFGCSECRVFDELALGCRAAWASDELAASLSSDPRWQASMLGVEVVLLENDGMLREIVASVRHVAAVDHVQSHAQWFAERARTAVASGQGLWQRRAQLFPHLDFCDAVQTQLIRFDGGSDQLRNIVRRLLELESAFQNWEGAPIDPDFVPSKCSTETQQTLREEEADHTFTLPSGIPRLFKWHVRFTPGAGRIFFDGDPSTRRGVVGYVGVKKGGRLV